MRLIFFILISSLITAREPIGLDEFVENYFLLSKSKMENSPIAWQDTREGYFRAYGVYKADQIIDSLEAKILTGSYFMNRQLPETKLRLDKILTGEKQVMSLAANQF